jgi:hypothetical protein
MKRLYRKFIRRVLSPRLLARLNHLSHIDDRLIELEAGRARLAEAWLRERRPGLFLNDSTGSPEFGIFSQNGEDGILLGLLEQTGAVEKSFVEIGVENARECNTALLGFVLSWNGLMLEADGVGVAAARRLAARLLQRKSNQVEIRQAFVTAENVDDILESAGFRGELGVLSIDVDGVDYWLWKAIRSVRPRLVVIEYNASLGCTEAITVPYKPDFDCRREHSSGFYHGASLAALEKLGRELGYALATVDSNGVNAFFVREDIRGSTQAPRSARELFREHRERSKFLSPEAQWAAIRHLPFDQV